MVSGDGDTTTTDREITLRKPHHPTTLASYHLITPPTHQPTHFLFHRCFLHGLAGAWLDRRRRGKERVGIECWPVGHDVVPRSSEFGLMVLLLSMLLMMMMMMMMID